MNAFAHVVPAEHEESAQFLSGLAQAKGIDIGGLLGGGGLDLGSLKPEQITAILTLLPLILGLLKGASGPGVGKPGELPVPPAPKPAPAPAEGNDTGKVEPEEPSEEADGQFIDAFENVKVVDMLNPDQSKAASGEDVMAGRVTQGMVKTAKGLRGQRVRLNCDPSFKGRRYPGNDPKLNIIGYGRTGPDGKTDAPRVQWRWWVNGKLASNSAEMPDAFHLGSYEDNAGTTPTLKLEAPVGPGRNECAAQPFIDAEDNGGVEVNGPKVAWFCD